ncbi:FecCD family ABC transporter permease [Spongiivirga citrea]|uniref:Iron chelate uptake ABC transporter family permease subunit n=1 Tax=Spongiivirga citrea TaxID=1481457 RepID=A0A6M0CKJ8_9FLAO|nr:iron ABC transporter permease [Spongiivirga citrea]NER18466.1 iron chelate uptake ABC transporter family permease subunit [Spongiivirga citrea]
MSNNKTYHLQFVMLSLLVLVLFVVNISLGSVHIAFDTILSSLFDFNDEGSTQTYIIQHYRLPKAITAILVGAGLGISGMLMQTLFRNPLAGPFVLGLSSGASLGVALLIMGSGLFGGILATTLLSYWGITAAAAIGCFAVLLLVVSVANKVRDTMAILIIGLMFGSLTAAFVSVMAYFSSAEQLQKYVFWSYGSLGDLSWNELALFTVVFLIGLLLSILSIKSLNSLLLGENYAQSLGLKIKRSRFIIIIATSLLAGSITAFAGPIAFVGLAVPHLTRQIFNTTDHKILLPAIALYGAILMLLCDSIAQIPFSQYTLPINAVTSLVGAPVVIWLLVKKRKMMF